MDNLAETEVLPRLSPGGPYAAEERARLQLVSGRPERSSGDRQIIWRRWRRQHIHTRATLLRPVQVLDHHSQRTPPPSACAVEAGGCWLLSSADQSTPQLTDQPARRDAAARCTPPRRQQPSHTAVPLLIAGFCRELGLRGPRFDDWVLPLPSPLVAFVAGFACVRQAGQGSPLRAFRGVFGLVQSVYLLRGVGDEQASRRRRSPPAGW